jgi:radical SAM superfamily enzyme YgiQ (UPF0313 family)
MKALFIVDDYQIDPLGISYLSSYLNAAGHEVNILKWRGTGKVDCVGEYHPDMVCYSVTTGKHTYYQALNRKLKKLLGDYFLSAFGGPHPTFFPKFAEAEGVDVIVRGEGFDAIVDIGDACEAKLPLTGIPNTVVGDVVAPLRPLKDKTTLLHPDRELIYSYPENFNNPIKNVMCSFFCPARCPYCYNDTYKKMYGIRTAEIRPVDDVMAEIDELKAYPLELIFFQDDIFPVYDSEWLAEFCEAYREMRVPFHIQVRVEMLTKEIVRDLKLVGLHGVTFAVESGNAAIRTNLLGRRMSDHQIVNAANMVHDAGVKLRIENMVGVPGETWNTALETLDLNIKCKPTIGWASLFQPYWTTWMATFSAITGCAIRLLAGSSGYRSFFRWLWLYRVFVGWLAFSRDCLLGIVRYTRLSSGGGTDICTGWDDVPHNVFLSKDS